MKLALNSLDLLGSLDKDMLALLKGYGQEAVQVVVAAANRQGVEAPDLPYVFWALATAQQLPNLGNRLEGFRMAITIMTRTGTMPNYQRGFKSDPELRVDAAVDAVAQQLANWSMRTLRPALMVDYYHILKKYEAKVPEATSGKVRAADGVDYLDRVLREVVTLRSSMFRDGEFLRRVLQFIPAW